MGLGIVLLLILSLSAAPVSARTITVNSTCSLADAITAANTDTATGSCAAGSGADVINLTGDVSFTNAAGLSITEALTINGTKSGDGNHKITATGRLFIASSPSNTAFTLTINDLTLTNNNSTTADDELITVNDSASLKVSNSIFTSIKSNIRGAAIRVPELGAGLTIENTEFSHIGNNVSTASQGGAPIYVISVNNNTPVKISNSRFISNQSREHGGALYLDSNITLEIKGSRFKSNSAGGSGGAIYFASGSGGPDVTIESSEFDGNSADEGGALFISDPDADTTIRNSLFKNNSAVDDGGAIDDRGAMNIYRSVLHNNSASDSGGAIISVRSLTLENSTLFNNTSVNHGGALYGNHSAGTDSTTVKHVTFVNNEATGAGQNGNSIYAESAVYMSVINSIIKTTASHVGTDCEGLDASSFNIIEDGSCSTSSTITSDPLLGARTGGSRPYYPIGTNSPAYNAARSDYCTGANGLNSPHVDQRGRSRPYGDACDIGAFEWHPPPPPGNGNGGGGGGGGRGGGGSEDATPTPVPMSSSICYFCPDLEARGFKLSATHGFASGVQMRQIGRDGIGDPSVLNDGFLDAVDVWGYAEQGVEVCFPGTGSLVLLDAATSPRTKMPLNAYMQDGRTCARTSRAGTMVLMAGQPAPTVTPPPPRNRSLSDCMVTTNYILNFRARPSGDVMEILPHNITLTALGRTANWYRVDNHGVEGWLHADYVTPRGTCE